MKTAARWQGIGDEGYENQEAVSVDFEMEQIFREKVARLDQRLHDRKGATGETDHNLRPGYSAELAERRLRASFKRRGKKLDG